MALQFLAEQCLRLGVGLRSQPPTEHSSWRAFSCKYDQLVDLLAPQLIEAVAEMFVRKGDIISELYTQTVAMHSSAIRAFAPRLPPATKNVQITVERRMHNMIFDHSSGGRNDQYNMLVGKDISKGTYFPSLLRQPLVTASRLPRSFCFNAAPCFFDRWPSWHLLAPGAATPCWVCPGHLDIVQVYIFLAEPVLVTEIAITIRHGVSDATSPHRVEIYAGPYLDSTVLALQTSLPRCEDGTRLLYRLASLNTECSLASISLEPHALPAVNSRVVHCTFHGIPDAYMTLGQIEVIGAITTPSQTVSECQSEMAAHLEAQDAARRDYHNILMRRVAPPMDLTEALELEVLRLRAAVTPAQRDAEIRRMQVEGGTDRYNIFAHTPNLEIDIGDAKKTKDGWHWGKLLGQSASAEQKASGADSEIAKQKVLFQTAVDLLKRHSELRHWQIHVSLARSWAFRRQCAALTVRQIEGFSSLAIWPEAGLLLSSVQTASSSSPPESLLYPQDLVLENDAGWHAPAGCTKADFYIVLPRVASVMCIRLCPGNIPYDTDLPSVELAVGSVLTDLVECKISRVVHHKNGEVDFHLHNSVVGSVISLTMSINTPVCTQNLQKLDHVKMGPWYVEQTANGFSHVEVTIPQTTAVSSGPVPQPHHISARDASPPHAESQNRVLRSRRVAILGKFVAVPEMAAFTETERRQHFQIMQARPPTARQIHRPVQQRVNERLIELHFHRVVIRGFSITVAHGEAGPESQVRLLDVTITVCEGEGPSPADQRQISLGRFHVPKTSVDKRLFFDFSEVSNVIKCSFEFSASYGSLCSSMGIISVYC